MRVFFIIVDEPIFHPLFFKTVVNILQKTKHQIIGVCLVPEGFGKTQGFTHSKKLLTLFGFKATCVLATKKLLFQFLDNIRIKNYTLESICKKFNINVYRTQNINSDNFLKIFTNLDIDLIIS